MNPYVAKIIIAARKEDSINAIAARISLSYGWTYKWVNVLAKKGVFRLTRMNCFIDEHSSWCSRTISHINAVFGRDVQFYYEVLSLLGIRYCFTQTDAVFIWTKGGYNIARYKDFYPIFIRVKKSDRKIFEAYIKKLKLPISRKQGIFYRVKYEEDFPISFCEGVPVDSLDGTIQFMNDNIYNFEPALEMVKDMYGKKINAVYQEAVTNV